MKFCDVLSSLVSGMYGYRKDNPTICIGFIPGFNKQDQLYLIKYCEFSGTPSFQISPLVLYRDYFLQDDWDVLDYYSWLSNICPNANKDNNESHNQSNISSNASDKNKLSPMFPYNSGNSVSRMFQFFD